jgi:TolA-binding protein
LALSAALVLVIAAVGLYHWNFNRIPQRQFDRGEALLLRGEYSRAYSKFRHLYEYHPQFKYAPQALLLAGEILQFNLNQDREALLAYLLVERDYPGHEVERKATRRAADIYKYRLGEYDRALTSYQKLLDGGNDDGEGLQYEIADTYFKQNNFEQARIEFESLLKSYPQSERIAEVLFRIASASALEGALEEASFVYQRVAEEYPDSPFFLEALYGLAVVKEERGELQAALTLLQDLKGRYRDSQVLENRIKQVRKRINKKRKAT